PQDRFAIGGRYSVRGFDGESSLIGERGWWWRNELAAPLGQGLGGGGWQAFVGLDQGRVGGPSAHWGAGRRLAGAVLGLRAAQGAWQGEVFVGAPLHRPEGFRTASTTAGFQFSAS